jgi:hypothetical protein
VRRSLGGANADTKAAIIDEVDDDGGGGGAGGRRRRTAATASIAAAMVRDVPALADALATKTAVVFCPPPPLVILRPPILTYLLTYRDWEEGWVFEMLSREV